MIDKARKSHRKGQSALEYVLLTSVAILALIASTMILQLYNPDPMQAGGLERHFNNVVGAMAPGTDLTEF